jgi:hypothetical protein
MQILAPAPILSRKPDKDRGAVMADRKRLLRTELLNPQRYLIKPILPRGENPSMESALRVARPAGRFQDLHGHCDCAARL